MQENIENTTNQHNSTNALPQLTP